jgi:hypothetical protein
MFGYDREELVGNVVEDLVPSQYRRIYANHRAGLVGAPADASDGI